MLELGCAKGAAAPLIRAQLPCITSLVGIDIVGAKDEDKLLEMNFPDNFLLFLSVIPILSHTKSEKQGNSNLRHECQGG